VEQAEVGCEVGERWKGEQPDKWLLGSVVVEENNCYSVGVRSGRPVGVTGDLLLLRTLITHIIAIVFHKLKIVARKQNLK
jgi:hypothetical protein